MKKASKKEHKHKTEVQSKKIDRCVDDMKAKGQADGYNPYAVCTASVLGKAEEEAMGKAWQEYAKSEKTGIPELDSPIHVKPKKPVPEMERGPQVNPQVQPNMRTQPKQTTDWETASLEEERHQDELNELLSANETDYDEASAYEHEWEGEGWPELVSEAMEARRGMDEATFAMWVSHHVAPSYAGILIQEVNERLANEDIEKEWLPYKEWKAKQEKEKGEKKDKKKHSVK